MTKMGVTEWGRAPLMVWPRRGRPLAEHVLGAAFYQAPRRTRQVETDLAVGQERPLNCCRFNYPRAERDRHRSKALSGKAGMPSAMALNVSARLPEIERPGGHPASYDSGLIGLGPPWLGFLDGSWWRVEKGVKPRFDDRIALARLLLQPGAI